MLRLLVLLELLEKLLLYQLSFVPTQAKVLAVVILPFLVVLLTLLELMLLQGIRERSRRHF